jgi:hypothetical protein
MTIPPFDTTKPMRKAMRFVLGLAFVMLLPVAGFAQTTVSPVGGAGPPEFPGLETIRSADLMQTVDFLASRPLAGRLAGSPGFMKAAHEMARRFRALGLEPSGEDGFYQSLKIEYEEITEARLAIVRADGVTHVLRLGPDFTCRGFTGSGHFAAPVVFAGYGLSTPEKGYDDYAGIDARGKVVLTFKAPPPFRLDTLGWGDSTLPRPKGRAAAAHGARGLLIVAQGDPEGLTKPIGSVLEGPGPEDQGFPRLMVDVPVAQEMLAGSGLELAALKAGIDSTKSPHSLDLPVSVRVEVRARYRPEQPSVNVVGILTGADPALRDQYLVVGAHLDHVGSQAHLLFPGANDNASGVGAVMAIAEAFARGGARPGRSVIFALFSSEESGLNGAKRFVVHPPVPLGKIVAYINLDCVAVGDSIQLGSGKTSPKLWDLARDLDARGARRTVAATWGGGGADATPFAEKGIPTLYFASRPSYAHLHQPGDTPDTLNPRLYETLVRLAYQVAWKVAQGEYAGE